MLSGGERSRLAMIRLLLSPVNFLILDEPTNHLDMPSKDVLKEAIKAFDGTAIIVSHDREFLDGLVSKVYEFADGRVREHIGGIYDYLASIDDPSVAPVKADDKPSSATPAPQSPNASGNNSAEKESYAERKERMKKISRAEKAVKESENKIEKMEARLKELDNILCHPENASDMTIITEYTSTKRALDEEVEKWETLSMQLEEMKSEK